MNNRQGAKKSATQQQFGNQHQQEAIFAVKRGNKSFRLQSRGRLPAGRGCVICAIKSALICGKTFFMKENGAF